MRTALALAITAALSACATTPADFRERGLRYTVSMKQPTPDAAACAARAIENSGDLWWGQRLANLRQGLLPGTLELNSPGALVADIRPEGSGSRADIYASPHMLTHLIERLIKAFEGC